LRRGDFTPRDLIKSPDAPTSHVIAGIGKKQDLPRINMDAMDRIRDAITQRYDRN
jgi:hypothetical protein